MRIKCRGYEGILLSLESDVNIIRVIAGERVRQIRYKIFVSIDDRTGAVLEDVTDSEIEVIHED